MGENHKFLFSRFINSNISTTLKTHFVCLSAHLSYQEAWNQRMGTKSSWFFPWIGWYKNFICCFVTLGLSEGNLYKTLISKPILKLKHSIHIFIHQIVNEARNHHQMSSSLLTIFSCTKGAQDKHNVPVSQNKVFSLSDIHLSQT